MQRRTDEGVIIACDFTGLDWDEQVPMIEGRLGAVISLSALARAIEEAEALTTSAPCTMCREMIDPPTRAWSHPDPPPSANAEALICWDCIEQADRAFAKDPDTDWQRRTGSMRGRR